MLLFFQPSLTRKLEEQPMPIFKIISLAFAVLLSTSVVAEDEWRFKLSPYIWLAGFEGEAGPLKNAPPSETSISASDAFADTDVSLMMIIDAKKGRHGIYTDIFYSDIESTETLNTATNTQLNSRTKTTMLTLSYSLDLHHVNGSSVDLLAGARWWSIDADVSIGSQIPALNMSGNNSESWFDPFVGVKGYLPITDSQFYISGGASVGGFDINADSFYEINANVGYQWSEHLASAVGYRLYDLDYDQNNFQYDVKQSGWVIGLTLDF